MSREGKNQKNKKRGGARDDVEKKDSLSTQDK